MTNESDYKEPVLHSVVKYFTLFMSLLYAAIGVLVLWYADEMSKELISPTYAIPFGIVLITYGAIRGYQAYQKYF